MALDQTTLNGAPVFKDTKTDTATNEVVVTTYDENFEIIGVEKKDAGGNTLYKSAITADTTGFSAAAEVASGAALTLGGDKAAGGKVTNTAEEKVSITSAGDDSGMEFEVVGTNAAGEVVTELVTGANDGTATTSAGFLEVTSITAVGDPAGTVSVAGEGYQEVVEQTETRKEPNDAGDIVDVTFSVEKTINYDGGAKIKSGTEKIDGKEKTLGENGVVTAETMDTSLLGDAISGDTLVAVAARYDSVAANATIYAEEENLGGGTKVTTLYAADNTIVGSSDTSVETFGDMTLTVTNHFAAPVTDAAGEIVAGEYIGTSGTDGTNTWDFTKTEVTTDSGMSYDVTFTNTPAYKETGSESYGGETRSFTYFFNKATGELLSGTEVVDGITTTFGANWLITAEAMDTGNLGVALASSVLDDLPASVKAETGNTYSKTVSFDWGGGETTYFNAQGITTGFAYTWADASGNSNNSYYDAQDNYVGDSWSDAEGRSGSSSVAIATDGSKVETGSYADTNNSSDDSSWTYNFNADGEMTGGSEVRGATTTTLGANWSVSGKQVAVTGLSQLNLDNVDDNIETAFMTVDADGISVSADVANNAALVIGGALSTSNVATNAVAASVSIASAGNDSAISFTVVGTNAAGAALTETVTGSNAGIALSAGEFKTITSVTAVGNPAGKVTVGSRHTTVYESTETFDWGGSLTTMLDGGGNIVGYADSYSDDWDGDGNVDSSGTTYMLSDWSYAGSQWSDSWGYGEQWVATLAADGSELASGHTREFGKNSWSDGNGGQETREYDYTWDSNYNLVEGKETGSDGITTIYGANWSITSQKGDTTKLGDALTTAELAGVPTSIQSALTNAETYAKTAVYDWGTDTTYYDSNGTILGYANSSSWDMDDGGSNTNNSYHDANWNWLGGSWADKDANGAIIRSGSNSTVNTYTDATNTTKTSFIDSGSYREGDEGSSYSWTFNVTYDANGYEIHEMDGGTEVRGTYNASGVLVGTTYTYGPDWVLTGAQADTSNLATLDLSTLDASLVTALFGSADAVIKYSTESFDWNQGFSQSTYYDANDAIVGYGDSWSDDWDGDGTVDSTGQSFMDANWNYVGGSYNDEYGSGHNFTIKTAADLDSISVDAAVANNGVLVIGGALASSGSITHTVAQKVAISSSGDDSNISFTVVGTDAAGAALTETVMGANAGTASSGSLFLTITSITAVGDPAANVSVGTMKTIQEIGENTWSDYDGNDQTNKYDFTYDADYNLMAGSEERGQKGADGTLSGGETVTYGANWEVLSVSRDVNLSSEAISELSSTDLAGIPTALHAAAGATYAETEVNPWGTSITYLDSDGQILGYSDAWTEAWGSGTNYQDADWNHLGSTYDDEWSTGFHHTVESTLNGNKVYIETGSRTEKNADGSLGEVTTNEFIFDENWNMISGTETRGLTTTTFVENWVIDSQETDMDNVGTVDVSGLPASVQTLLFTGETLTAVKATAETFPGGGSLTTYYDTNGIVLGYMDTYVDDFNGSSGTSFMDGNWEHLGGTYVDEWGSGSNFTVKTSADIDSVSAAAAVADGGSLVIGGALAAGGSVTHAAAQKVTISSTGDDSGITFTVVGTDEKGAALTETVTGANADMAVSQLSFLTITGITAVGDPAGNVSVGTLEVIVESGTSTWTNYENVVESRSFSFSYDENYNLLAGTETTSDDTTITWGAGWTQLASQISVTGMTALTSDQLDDLPTPLKAAVGDTYAKIQDWGYGSKQTTYLDGAGNILGYHDSWDDEYGSGSSYMDANWNHLGGSNASNDGNYSSSSFREISLDSISVSEEVANNGALVLAGSLTDGTFTLTDAHKVTITSAGNDAARTFRVVGTDNNGDALIEVVTGANAGTATSTAAFLTVTGITAIGDPAGKVSASFEGIEKEVGTNSWKEGEGQNQVTNTSSYAFNYDAGDNMIGGTEIRPDLTTVKFGANWAFLGEQIDTSTALVLSDSDADGISTLASVADNADLVIGGALAQAGAVTHTAAQIVTIKSVGNDSGISFEVFGTNPAGIATTETVNGANAGTATTVGQFLTITKITMTGAANGQVSAGTAGMKAGIPSAVLSTLTDGVTKYIDVPHGQGGGDMSMGLTQGSGFERTFLDSDGSILGYMNTFSDGSFSGTDFMDANWKWLGGTGSDDWMQWSNSTVDALNGNNEKIGTIETRTETEKNYNGNDPAGVYTGQQRITVTEFDLDSMMVTRTETTTLDSGDKLEFVFDSNFEIIGEYTYELVGGSYQKLITDKYALFQLEKFNMQAEYLKGYALDQGYTNLVDGDGDGEIDIYVEDNDGDGVGDLVSSFTRAMMDATVFAGAAGGEPTFTIKDGKIESLGFTSNGLNMVLMGDFTLKTAQEIAALDADDRDGPDMIAKGTITASYIYDTANSGALVGYADTLNINFMDINSFMTARSTFNIGSSQTAVGMNYEIHDDSVDHANDNTKTSTVDDALKSALNDAGFDVAAITAGTTDITKEMIEALQRAEPDYEAPAAIRSLTDMMGGSSAFADIASSHGSDAMGMGGEQRYDAMGNNINVIDDGFGNITEMMVDPANPNIQIKTEYLANGDVVLTQLITDDITKVVTEVSMGSGSKVEGQYFDEISTVTNGLAVTEREYDMSNVYLKVAVDEATGAKTETSKDARGYESEFVSAADNSFVETTKTPDGKTSIVKDVDQFGGMTITQTVKNTAGEDVTTTVGTGTSIAVAGGGRIDTTIKNDGSKSVINVAANGDEIVETYTATVSQDYLLALTDAGWGAAVSAPAAAPIVVIAPTHLEPQATTYTANTGVTIADKVTFIDIKFFDALIAANWPNLFNGSLDSTGSSAITTEMIMAVGGTVPVGAGGGGGAAAAPADIPEIGAALTTEMVQFLVTAGAPPVDATYTLAATSENQTLEDGSTQQITTVGTQKVITTHTVQDDGSLKAVSKTEGGTTLKEQITTYDAAGLPTVTAKEYLGQNHTRVTVSDAETKTVVTENAGAVTKAVKDIAADKTVTTTVDANKGVVVTEQTGDAAAVTTASGTLVVAAGTGVETLTLTTVNADGVVTGSEVLTVEADGTETKVARDTNDAVLSETEEWEYNDGTVWTLVEQGGVSVETYTKTNGEIETITTQANGTFEVTQQLLNDAGVLQASTTLGSGTATTVNGLYVETIDLGGGDTEIRSWDVATQTEVTTFKTDGVTTSVQTEQTLANGNNTVEVDVYTGGDATNLGTLQTSTNKVISTDNTVQTTVIAAAVDGVRAVTVSESGVDGAGKDFSKVLGTGTQKVVNNETIKEVMLSDNSKVIEKYDANNNIIQKTVADQAGDSKVSTFTGGEETIAYSDALGETIDKSEVDIKLDIGFANADLGFVNLDYTDMAGGYTSQAGDFDMSVDYSNDEFATSEGGYGGQPSGQVGPTTAVTTGANDTSTNLGYTGTSGTNTNNQGPDNAVADYSDLNSFYETNTDTNVFYVSDVY